MLDELHPGVEWYPWLQVQVGGEATLYRGHDGIRDGIRDGDEAFSEIKAEPAEVRDLGERVVAIGHLRHAARGDRLEPIGECRKEES